MSTGFSGMVHGSGYTQTHEAWRVGTRATLVHFVRDNFAIGGTFMMELSRYRDTAFGGDQESSYIGGDLDVIGHVPLTRLLSLRFWGWVGIRQRRRDVVSLGPSVPYAGGFNPSFSGEQITTQKLRYAVIGFAPELLIHCSSSVALGLGPSFHVLAPLSEDALWDWSLNLGPSLSYSFGTPPHDETTQKAIVPRFAGRGRNVLAGGVSIGTDLGASIGYARFVTDHFALGPTLFGGADDRTGNSVLPYWVGAGLQMLAETPLRGRWSMLFWSAVSYRYDRFDSVEDGPYRYGPTYDVNMIKTHELQLTGSVYPAFHLFEALVLGLGPTVTEHVRLATSVEGLDRAYLSLGVTSVLAGSF